VIEPDSSKASDGASVPGPGTEKRPTAILASLLAPAGVGAGVLAIWYLLAHFHVFPDSAFPTPGQVVQGFIEKCRHGEIFDDIVASLYRVVYGFVLAVILGIPLGLWIGTSSTLRTALLPAINFFRSLSPLAWIPFAIMWLGIGDRPSIFLIFMTAFFPIVLSTCAAVAQIPAVYFRVARDFEYSRTEMLIHVTLPAIMPQVITSLRVTAGLSWVVVVAAEMIAGRDGLGFLIWDGRNLLRPDLVVVGMVIIGCIGVIIDRLISQLMHFPSIRWGYDK